MYGFQSIAATPFTRWNSTMLPFVPNATLDRAPARTRDGNQRRLLFGAPVDAGLGGGDCFTHWIIWSARSKIDSGTVNPSAFAVFRLTTSLTRVERSNGRSLALAPFSTRSMKTCQLMHRIAGIQAVVHQTSGRYEVAV